MLTAGAAMSSPTPDTPRESLVASIARDLREQILTGRLRPGRRISQASIADHYGVSRLPVREALRALSTDGLLLLEPSRGARVAPLNRDDLREVFLLRERLEPMVVTRAVPGVTELDLVEAEELVRRMDDPDVEPEEWLGLDRQFHTMWYDLAAMPRLIRIVDQLWDVAQRYRVLWSMTPGAANSNVEHWLLLECIRRRSAQDAAAILEVHIRHTLLTLEASFAPEPPSPGRRVGERSPGPAQRR